MTTVVEPSWVTVTLDTRPPKVKVTAPASVDPPEDWDILLVADEEIGGAHLVLVDSFGTQTPLGYEAVDDRTLRVLVPSEGVSGGHMTLRGSVWDVVDNAMQVEVRGFTRKPKTIEARMTIERAYAPDLNIDHRWTIDLTMGRAFDMSLEVDDA